MSRTWKPLGFVSLASVLAIVAGLSLRDPRADASPPCPKQAAVDAVCGDAYATCNSCPSYSRCLGVAQPPCVGEVPQPGTFGVAPCMSTEVTYDGPAAVCQKVYACKWVNGKCENDLGNFIQDKPKPTVDTHGCDNNT